MYFDYLRERLGFNSVVKDEYFFTYRVEKDDDGKILFFRDVYIKPEFRKSFTAVSVVKEINATAIQLGCEKLYTMVDLKTVGHEKTVINLLKYGFKFHRVDLPIIYFMGEVRHG